MQTRLRGGKRFTTLWPFPTAAEAAVTDLAEGESILGDTAESELEARMTRMLPNVGGQPLIKLGADAVAAELAGAHIPSSPLE